jgi:hypothetical protein
MKTFRHFWPYIARFFLEWEMFYTKVVEKTETRILCSILFFPENRTVYEIISKNVVETEGSQMTSQYGAYALRAWLARLYARMRMHTTTCPGTYMHACTCKHAHTDQYVTLIAFYTATMVSWTHLNVALHVHCVSCSYYYRYILIAHFNTKVRLYV